ncbi:MAG: DUF1636 domain-containing protein [Leptolyngbyaceae bacterium]|nr:DUF1636 domain-containing protein [Leptolyngbyaceae bacterium]
MPTQHVLFICQTCAFSQTEREHEGQKGGQYLLEAVKNLHQEWELQADVAIQPVECLSACSRSCAVALAAPGKYTYLFGDLPAQTSASAVLECASLYVAADDGYLPWANRPQPFKNGILARIPPLPSSFST